MDVGAWLKGLGLERYAASFEENGVDAALLPELTNEDLKDLGVARLAERKQLLKAIAALAGTAVHLHSQDEDAAQGTGAAAERRHLTVMFCDLVGSTALSTRIDPEEFSAVIGDYQVACAAAVTAHGGTVAKYLGDGVLVYFGFPQAHEDDAERAVHAGLDVIESVRALAPGGEALRTRVGIATGLVVVGQQIGEGTAQEQAVVGEAPNLAARLQGLAEPDAVVIADATYRLTGGRFEVADLGAHAVKGFDEPVRAWRVTGIDTAASRFEARRATRDLAPVVGREKEIALLLDLWNRARTGKGQTVLISGEAGIGKSRLLQALQERIGDQPHIRLRYNCSPRHTNSAFYPIIAQLEAAAGFKRGDNDAVKLEKLEAVLAGSAGTVAEAAPLFASLLAVSTEGRYSPLDLEPKQQKEAIQAALNTQLEGLAASDSIVMFLEDAHWIDPTTLELFEVLVQRAKNLPVLLIVTSRPEFQPTWITDEHFHELALARLEPADVAKVIAGTTGAREMPDAVVAEIVAKTDGVPLFVEELTKSLLESGQLRETGGRFVLTEPLRTLAVPATLQESLIARLDRLAPVKEVAQIGAAIGRSFSHAVLAAIVGAPELELRGAIARLEDAELLFRRGRPPNATYTFKHALVQDVAYRSMLRSTRVQLHGRIAAVLQQQFADTEHAAPELLAHHLSEAGETEAAVGAWRAGGRRAFDLAALVEAAAYLGRALELLQDLPETSERQSLELDLRIELAQALFATKGYLAPETEQNFDQAMRLCETLGETGRLFPVLYGRWVTSYAGGAITAARSRAEKILALAQGQTDSVVLAVAHRLVATSALQGGEATTAHVHLERVLALLDSAKHDALGVQYGQDVLAMAWIYEALVHWHLGYADTARRFAQVALDRANAVSHMNTLGHVLTHAVLLHANCRDWDTAESFGQTAIKLGRDHDMPVWRFAGDATLTGARMIKEPATAHTVAYGQALQAYRNATKMDLLLPLFHCWLAEAQNAAGSVTEAAATLEAGMNLAESQGDRICLPEFHRLRGEILATGADCDPAEAATHFRRAIDVAETLDAPFYKLRAATGLARLLHRRGQKGEAKDLLAPVHAWFTEGFDLSDLTEAKALLDEIA